MIFSTLAFIFNYFTFCVLKNNISAHIDFIGISKVSIFTTQCSSDLCMFVLNYTFVLSK